MWSGTFSFSAIGLLRSVDCDLALELGCRKSKNDSLLSWLTPEQFNWFVLLMLDGLVSGLFSSTILDSISFPLVSKIFLNHWRN